MPNLNFYIDINKAPMLNPVLSVSNNTPDSSDLTFVSGDKFPVNIFFVNSGVLDTSIPVTGSASSSFYLAVGEQTAATPLTSTNRFFISQSYCITGSLDFNTAGVTGSFSGTDDYITKTLQLSVYTPSGSLNRRTYMLKKVKIFNAVDN